jgi:hypothetical protein
LFNRPLSKIPKTAKSSILWELCQIGMMSGEVEIAVAGRLNQPL